MRKVFFIIGLSLIITIGLSGCFGPFKKQQASQTEDAKTSSKSKQSSSASADAEALTDKEESFFGSMQDLINRGKSLKCTYKEKNSDGDESEITMYISGGKVRTEAEVNTDEGKKIENNMVIDKDWMYMWNSFTPNGMKMDMRKMPKGEDVIDSDINKDMANLAENMDYKCRAWILNNSKFKIPANIQFNDITEMMSGMSEGIMDMTEEDIKEMEEESNKWICEHCKSAPDPAECLGDVVCD